jgi:hypothetical protein
VLLVTDQIESSGAAWFKSSRSDNGGACIEVAPGFISGFVPVRDSKAPEGPTLLFRAAVFVAFVGAIKAGEFAEWEQQVTP